MKAYLQNLACALLNYYPYYPAARMWSDDRSYLPGWLQDMRLDMDRASREEIARKARALERYSPIVQRIADLMEQNVAGPKGPQMIPASSAEDWNERVMEVWEDEKDKLELTGTMSWAGMHSVEVRNLLFDGGHFLVKSSEGNEPRIQFVEVHRVKTPHERRDDEGKGIIDGVRIDTEGRKRGYFVNGGISGESFEEKSVKEVLHVYEPCRAGQYRELSMLYPVMDKLQDYLELHVLEMRAAKTLADRILAFFTKSRELPKTNYAQRRLMTVLNQTSSGATVTDSRIENVRKGVGGTQVALGVDEKMEQIAPVRPTQEQRYYWDLLISESCIGIGLPRLLVLPPERSQGTIARADYDIAAAFFLARFETIKESAKWKYNFWLEHKVARDRKIANRPGDWRKVEVIPPRAINVDVGYTADAIEKGLAGGWVTFQWICGQYGFDYRKVLRQKAIEAAFVDRLSEEYQTTPERIRAAFMKAVAPKTDDPGFPEEDDEETDETNDPERNAQAA